MAEKGLDSTIKCNAIGSIGVPFLANFVGLFANVDKKVVEFRTPNYARILRIMQSLPSVTIDSLREQLGINKSAVQRLLSSLKEKGYIEARDNKGGWRVLITPSV